MTAYFLDSSAVIKRYVPEAGTVWVRAMTMPSTGNTILESVEQLLLFVVPVRPMERNEAIRQALQEAAPAWRKHRPSLQP